MSGKTQAIATAKALDVLEYMRTYRRHRGYVPDRLEMAEYFVTSTSVINYRLKILEKLQLILVTWGEARAIKIMPASRPVTLYVCSHPECTFFSTSSTLRCPEHPRDKREAKQFEEMQT